MESHIHLDKKRDVNTNHYDEFKKIQMEFREQREQLKRNQQALKESEEKYRLAVEGANDILWDWNFVKKSFSVSEKWKNEMGYSNMDSKLTIIGKWVRTIHKDDLNKAINALKDYLKGKKPYFCCEYRSKYRDKEYIWILVRGKILRDEDGRAIRMAGSISNITDRKKYEQKIKRLAYYDRLTKLPNKHFLKENMDKRIRGDKHRTQFSLLALDIDNFRSINDIFGHTFGDKVLVEISKNLKNMIGKDDILSRISEDEFIIMKAVTKNCDEVSKIAQDILKFFSIPVEIDGHEIYISMSIGIVIYPNDGIQSEVLIRNADSTMYLAKEHGKNTYEFFIEDIYDEIIKKTNLELDLRRAVRNNEFLIYYQPQMNLKTNKITGVEALIRWKHPDRGMISPMEFIPLAERTGLIVPIGKWVLCHACEQNKIWMNKFNNKIKMSINVSVVQIQQRDFLDNIKFILEKTQMEPQWLDIEITESTLMNYIEKNIKKLNELKKIGVSVSLDDFGTGYSSLSYLKRLPIDTLKIDKSFVDDIKKESADNAITGEIIQLAHKMYIDVVAEGVEMKEQLKFLAEQNCDKIQGYILSKPMPARDIEKYFSNNCYL